MKVDMNIYVEIMERINYRKRIVDELLEGDFDHQDIEYAVLQVRKIVEYIALSTLCVNKSIFDADSKKFKKYWKPDNIIQDLELLAIKGTFPEPILNTDKLSKEEQEERTRLLLENKILNSKKLIEIHNGCGRILHAQNPYGETIDYKFYWERVPKWINDIWNLMESHTIMPPNYATNLEQSQVRSSILTSMPELKTDPSLTLLLSQIQMRGIYLVHMQDEGDRVSMTEIKFDKSAPNGIRSQSCTGNVFFL